jgi:Tfp pilus assembly protein PilN
MIEINLLPGARKPKRGAGAGVNFGETIQVVVTRIKDPFLIIAVVGVAIGIVATGAQYFLLNQRTASLNERYEKARADSMTFAGVLAERATAEAQRDSVVKQFAIIEAIDGQRYVWPHILSEISRVLPPYTWLLGAKQMSPPMTIVTAPVDTAAANAAAKRKRPPRNIDSVKTEAVATIPKLKLQLIGQTADIQAVTRYWRLLEASPFIENVNLVNSDVRVTEGGDIVQFTLELEYQVPPRSAIRTVPLTVATR